VPRCLRAFWSPAQPSLRAERVHVTSLRGGRWRALGRRSCCSWVHFCLPMRATSACKRDGTAAIRVGRGVARFGQPTHAPPSTLPRVAAGGRSASLRPTTGTGAASAEATLLPEATLIPQAMRLRRRVRIVVVVINTETTVMTWPSCSGGRVAHAQRGRGKPLSTQPAAALQRGVRLSVRMGGSDVSCSCLHE
jgi:hypothetical protein